MTAKLRIDTPICVDGRMLRRSGTGVSTYARGLLDAAAQIGTATYHLSATHEYDTAVMRWAGTFSRSAQRLRSLPLDAAGRGEIVGRDIFRRAHVYYRTRRSLMQLEPDQPFGLMHWTYPVPIRMRGWINLYTVHDAIPLVRPDLSPIPQSRHRAVLRQLVRSADRLITVTEAARAEIIDALRCDPAKVVNCGEAVDVTGAQAAPAMGLATGEYYLFCGSLEPRKNLSALIKAFVASGIERPLVIVGPDGWRSEAIVRQIDASEGVVRLPYQSRPALLSLIANARALLFPSLAEGFGLPIVEAMALGTPVLTSHRGATAEVAGGAALLVDPTDAAAIERGCQRLDRDDRLLEALSRLGRERAETFSHAAFVERLARVYRDVISQSRSA